ncbi:GNAT family N-acetyltransferase [Tenacibaculum tangerinum]|uniref:GNAT family N-acetyltransferase n=1 Tax=Tenacibaculum tangerinum TaxID=3038772 RepID=A0ABY8L8Z8_9FLAO|nr:GNAT family N-acetyltransferase [Tenacibaculum tangerinum]WGH76619.1 GNAT family N-acetyltransferase [Tenacibaculum tangerinum]
MLYEAIYQPDETNSISRDVIRLPEISLYIDNFGQKENDYCLVADLNNKIIGAAWTRVLAGKIKGFGNVDDKTPEFAISLYKEYRNQGIGTLLMKNMISDLREKGYKQTSLSVQKNNYAFRVYQKLGFETISENNEDYLMLLNLR